MYQQDIQVVSDWFWVEIIFSLQKESLKKCQGRGYGDWGDWKLRIALLRVEFYYNCLNLCIKCKDIIYVYMNVCIDIDVCLVIPIYLCIRILIMYRKLQNHKVPISHSSFPNRNPTKTSLSTNPIGFLNTSTVFSVYP